MAERKKAIYTEIRIYHSTVEEKEEYEKKLDEALKKNNFKTRLEFVKEKVRELIRKE